MNPLILAGGAQIGETRSRQDIITDALVDELWIRIPELRPALSSLKYYNKRDQDKFAKGVVPFNGPVQCSREGDTENPNFCIGTEIYDHTGVLARLKEILSKPCAHFVPLPESDPSADPNEELSARSTKMGEYHRRRLRVQNIRSFSGCEVPRKVRIEAALHIIKDMDRLFAGPHPTEKIRANRVEVLVIPMNELK